MISQPNIDNPFTEFPKMPRLSREILITEKIDGTNGCIYIDDIGEMYVGSRSKWLTAQTDNFGFHKWCSEHEEELRQLGPGRHFGEWWGSGIQRGYGLPKGEKRFSLFNVTRWHNSHDLTDKREFDRMEIAPACCQVVPLIYRGLFDTAVIEARLTWLGATGSVAAPGFMKPEGIVVWHVAGNFGFKKTIEKDESPKSLTK